MEIKRTEICGFTVFELRGEINDLSVLDKVKKIIERTVKAGREDVAVDLHNCEYLNSGLIGSFMGWKKDLAGKGRQFCLIEPSEKAWEILNVTGIPTVVTIYRNEVEFQRKAKPGA